MKLIRLMVRDVERTIQGTVAPVWAGAVVGALAADPETLAELDTAMQRFQIDQPIDAWRASFEDSEEELAPGEWGAVIDLPARMIFWDGGPGPEAGVQSAPVIQDGRALEVELPFVLPWTWQIVDGREGWREQADERRRQAVERPPLDVRETLYGRLADWIAGAIGHPRWETAEDPIAAMHAAWLTTPRADLGGRTPRELLIAGIDDVERDMEWRCAEWSRLGRQPTPFPDASRAYRYGPIGLHEFILYYDLVRRLLHCAWEEQIDEPQQDVERLAKRLRDEQQRFLRRPQDEGGFDEYVPAEVIDLERRRVPLTASPESRMVDCDCPLCQMMCEESFGPMFVHFDTLHFDQEFVFSRYLDRTDWELDYGFGGDAAAEASEATSDEAREEARVEAVEGESADESDGAERSEAEMAKAAVGDSAAGGRAGRRAVGGRRGAADSADEGRVESGDTAYAANGGDEAAGPTVQMIFMPLEGRTRDAFGRQAEALLERTRATRSAAGTGEAEEELLWKRSFIQPPAPSASRESRLQTHLFEVAAHAAELRDRLRDSPEPHQALERVIEDFANLRAAMRERDWSRVQRLTSGCLKTLRTVEASRPDVRRQCADLATSFGTLERTIGEGLAGGSSPTAGGGG